MPATQKLPRGVLLAAALALAAAAPTPASEPEQDLAEHRLQVAFLYNFAKFVEWPGEPDGELRLCYFGSSDLGDAMEAIDGKEVHGQQLVTVPGPEPAEIHACQIVFLENGTSDRLQEIQAAIADSCVLTVTYMAEDTENRGIINVFPQRKNLRFQIDIEAAEQVGLRISSRLLQLAAPDRGGPS